LRRRKDIDRLFQAGRHHSGRLLALRSAPNEVEVTRFAYSVSKRVGKAVVRNRVRRRLREIARTAPLVEGFDVLITARPASAAAQFWELKAELSTLLGRARLLRVPDGPG
jgi:ribonuclease P protein component